MTGAIVASDQHEPLRPAVADVRRPHASVAVTRLVLVTDVTLYREGLRQLLAREAALDVVGVAASSAEALDLIGSLHPDVVLIDTSLEGGLHAARAMRAASPGHKLIALALSEDEADVIAWAEAGMSACVTRDAGLPDLVSAIDGAMNGQSVLSPALTASLLKRLAVRASQDPDLVPPSPLTSRELDIVQLIAQGLSNREIARALSIALPTVKNHVHNILEKMHVHRRAQAAFFVRHAPTGVAFGGSRSGSSSMLNPTI
jgi:two-component system, NarL family, nitrate/nitrite response regulator NarL